MNYNEKKIIIASYSPPNKSSPNLGNDNENKQMNNNSSSAESIPPPKPKRYNLSANNINVKFQYPNYVTKNCDDINYSLNVFKQHSLIFLIEFINIISIKNLRISTPNPPNSNEFEQKSVASNSDDLWLDERLKFFVSN